MVNVGPLQHTKGRARKKKKQKKTLGIMCYWTLSPLPSRPDLPHLSNPPYVTSVCCLGPPLCLRRELFFFLSSVWMIKNGLSTYIYLSFVIKWKDAHHSYCNLEWGLTLSWQQCIWQLSQLQWHISTTRGHLTLNIHFVHLTVADVSYMKLEGAAS